MYSLVRIDLHDTHTSADAFDEQRYKVVASDLSLEKVLDSAVHEFFKANPDYSSWADWENNAVEDGFEYEILTEEPNSIFRASILLKDSVMGALLLARKYHRGSKRKGDGLEYIVHILEITRLLDKRGFEAEIIAAAFCHDLLEDTKCKENEIVEACGKEVLRIVKAVSNDVKLKRKVDWEKKKEKYIQAVMKGGEKAIAVCIADKIVNLKALLKAYEKDGPTIWTRFNKGKKQKLWFEKSVLKMAKQNWKNPLVKDYAGLVKEMEALRDNKEHTTKQSKQIKQLDKDHAIHDWVITYEYGRKEAFRGLASESFNYASSQAKRFAVEKLQHQDFTDEELDVYFMDYTDREMEVLAKRDEAVRLDSDENTVYDFIIHYKDGKKQLFRGLVGQAIDYGYSQPRMFGVEREKSQKKSIEVSRQQHTKKRYEDYTAEELDAMDFDEASDLQAQAIVDTLNQATAAVDHAGNGKVKKRKVRKRNERS